MSRLLFSLSTALVLAASVLAQTVRMPDGEVAKLSSARPPQAQLKDGIRLVGVDMRWYTPAKADEQQLSDDDRSQIKELLTVPSFYDRTILLHLEGGAQRAVGLVELIRDRDFHAGKGEVIWRAELWYLEFQNGGWAKVSQQNKVIDRQRFETADAYQAYLGRLRFVPKLAASASTQAAEIQLAPADLITPSAAAVTAP